MKATYDGVDISDFRRDPTGRFEVEPWFYNGAVNATLERELRATKYGASMPNVDLGNRDSIIRWLQWNDPNGSYADEQATNEGMQPLTLREAQDEFLEMFTGD